MNPSQTTKLIDLTPFFNACSSRICCPWIDDVTFRHIATDGSILVAVESGWAAWNPEWNEQLKSFTKPGIGGLLKDFYGVSTWQKWHMQTCRECNDTKAVRKRCSVCNGSGRCTCPRCDDEHPCGGCDGTGEAVDYCNHCSHPVMLGRQVQRKYAAAIACLPNVEIGVPNPDPSDTEGPVYFRFDGGIGLVMPLRRSPDDQNQTSSAVTMCAETDARSQGPPPSPPH